MAKLVDLVQALGVEQEPESANTMGWVKDHLGRTRARLALLEKLEKELTALGPAKVDRVLELLNGKDPDRATMKVGPHGAGCECTPETDECTLEDEDEEKGASH